MDSRSDGNGSTGSPIQTNIGGRKRGHQHHIRNSGTRRSNVPADEVIAALRGDDTITVHNVVDQSQQQSDIEINLAVDNDNNNQNSFTNNNRTDGGSGTIDNNGNDIIMLNDDDNNINNNNTGTANHRLNLSRRLVSNILVDSTSERLNEMNLNSGNRSIGAGSSSGNNRNTNGNNCNLTRMVSPLNVTQLAMDQCANLDQDPNDSISSSSNSINKKSKSKRDGGSTKKGNNTSNSKSTTKSTDSAALKKEKRKRTKALVPPTEERPPLEGAAASDQWNDADIADIENDPEAAEWSKLRCTSERTEVVAEREYRRQNRRCADYPGLAFGRSIFSSDTMMKLNIIRNELHNIMKTQLKRVCCATNNGSFYAK